MTERMTEGDDDLMLWRQLLEVDLAEEEMVDPGWEEDDVDRESRERVFARVGIADAQASPRVVVEFLLDLESWLAAAAPQTALARDVGSIVDTLDLTLPELSAAGFGDSVEVECDLDSAGRVSELSVLIHGAAGPGLYLVLLGQDGGDVVAPVSQYGLARFIGLSIDVRSSRMLAFELRG